MAICGIASLPEREKNLEATINSLYNQFDSINIALNGYERIPSFLRYDSKFNVVLSSNNGGAKMKFFFVDGCHDYYFSCDDDLIYPQDYVDRMIDKIQQYNNKIIVTAHGGNIQPDMSVKVKGGGRRFNQPLAKDQFIMYGGTGVMSFYQPYARLSFRDFYYDNMVDVNMYYKTQDKKMPVLLINKPENWIKYQDSVLPLFSINKQKKTDFLSLYKQRLSEVVNPTIYKL